MKEKSGAVKIKNVAKKNFNGKKKREKRKKKEKKKPPHRYGS